MNKRYVIIVAGGTGSRMKSKTPKQYLLLQGKPVLVHTIQTFFDYNKKINIILVLPQKDIAIWEEKISNYFPANNIKIVEGGEERFHSVKRGLSIIKTDGIVAIHDGVRPLVTKDTIERCFKGAERIGNTVPVMDIRESIRIENDNGSLPFDRKKIRLVQTPQVFDIKKLQEAYKQEYNPEFTDDASVFEKAGNTIHLVEGNKENIKITTPDDLIIAEALLKDRKSL